VKKILKRTLNAKNTGTTIPAGAEVVVTFPKEYAGKYVRFTDNSGASILGFSVLISSYIDIKKPTMKTMEKWYDDGIAKSVGGKKVELDGWDYDDMPSWAIILGLI